jgi:hypothetical protein
MELTKGMNSDFHESNQPENTYRWATNWVSESYDSLTSELGNSIVNELSGDSNSPINRGYKYVGFVTKNNYVVCCSVNSTTGDSEIGIYDEVIDNYTPYINLPELNFNVDYPVRGLAKLNNKGDLVVVLNDRFNTPKIVTIDLTNLNTTSYYPNLNINNLELFPSVINFTGLDTSVIDGGSLLVGSYQVFIQYERIDGTTSSCYSDNIIHNIDLQSNVSYITGAIGSSSSKAIQVSFTPDVTWDKVNIGLANLSNTEVRIISSVYIKNSPSITVTLSSFTGELMAGGFDNINVSKVKYSKAHTQTVLNNSLWLGNLTKTSLEIPQRIINTLSMKWKCTWKDKSALPNKTLRSFQPNEVYSMFVRILKNGEYSQWYHIAGREASIIKGLFSPETLTVAGVPEVNTIPVNTINENDTYSTSSSIVNCIPKGNPQSGRAKYFHYVDSIDSTTVTSSTNVDGEMELSGQMSYWEQENELYDSYFNGDDLLIGASSGSLASEKVRHHKFPSKQYLNLVTILKFYTPSSMDGDISGSVLPYSDKSDLFISKVPELSAEIQLSGEFSAWVSSNIGTYDKIEIGYTSRDINNTTVITEDIALFGVYTNRYGRQAVGGDNTSQSLTDIYKTDALGFTGGNFNTMTNLTYPLNTGQDAPDIIHDGIYNGSFQDMTDNFLTGNWDEIMPNRQRVFSLDVVNDSDSTKFLNTNIDYVRHEVLMSSLFSKSNSILRNGDSDTPLGYPLKNLNSQSDPSSPRPYDCLGRHFLMLFDYTNNSSNPLVGSDGYSCYAASDFTYPNVFTIQNIESSEYILQGTNVSVSSEKPINGAVVNGIVYGGNNHLNLKFNNSLNRRLSINNALTGASNWRKASLMKQEIIIGNVNNTPNTEIKASLFSPLSPTPGLVNGYPFVGAPFVIPLPYPVIKYAHNTFITTLCKFNPTIYSSFDTLSIEVAPEGKGDVFISEVNYLVNGFATYGYGNSNMSGADDQFNGGGINSCIYRYYSHTRKNITERVKGVVSLTEKNGFYPLDTWNSYEFGGSRVLPQGFYLDDSWSIRNVNFLQSSVLTSYSTKQSKFPFRILKSMVTQKESYTENWTTFPVLDYYEIDKILGVISNLQGFDEKLLVQTVDRLLMTKASTNLQQSGFSIVIGTGDLFSYPLNEVVLDNSSGGYLGTKHQSACVLTQYGYFTYDVDRRRLYLITKDGNASEISLLGVRRLFEQYISNSYVNPVSEALEELPNDFTSGNVLPAIVYDHKYRRILFVAPQIGKTLSYYPELQQWRSAHTYLPVLPFNTKDNVYGLSTEEQSKVIKFNTNSNDDNFSGSAVSVKSTIDAVINTTEINTQRGIVKSGQELLKMFESINWQSEMREYSSLLDTNANRVIELDTFTSIQVRTNKQASVESVIKPYRTYGDITQNTRKYNNLWSFNRFRDNQQRLSGGELAGNICSDPITGDGYVINNSLSLLNTKRFIDTFIVVKLKFNTNAELKRLSVYSIDADSKRINK